MEKRNFQRKKTQPVDRLFAKCDVSDPSRIVVFLNVYRLYMHGVIICTDNLGIDRTRARARDTSTRDTSTTKDERRDGRDAWRRMDADAGGVDGRRGGMDWRCGVDVGGAAV